MTISRLRSETGSTMMEVLVASALMITLMAGLMSLAAVSLSTTENQGHLAARTAEYAQDKVEQLLALSYTDSGSDTTTFPATACITAPCSGSGLTVGGSSDTSSPVAKYVDWLDQSGNVLTSSGTTPPSGWYYERSWKVDDSTTSVSLPANLKQVTVTVTISRAFGGANKSTSTLTVLKDSHF
jgi:hypothetical protein